MLPTLAADSVQCVVTSPPYYALRSYLPDGHADKCREIGSEATPDEYLATMVAVFREVRRVLRPDGTCWVNLGSSYASGGRRPNQSPVSERAPANGTACTGSSGSLAPDYAYPGQRDEPQGGSSNHHARTFDTGLFEQRASQPVATIDRDNVHQASLVASPSPPDVQASTILSSTPSGLDAPGPACVVEAPAFAPTLQPATRPSAHTAQSKRDTSSPSAISASRKQGKALSSRACDCGSCGICWAYLAIPLLKFKAKDLMMMPALFALALQADGWFVRSDVIWSKPNPMPESTVDRPTSAHEHVFLLTRNARYFYDADAVREPHDAPSIGNRMEHFSKREQPRREAQDDVTRASFANAAGGRVYHPAGRSCRNVWTIATHAYPQAHFATYPPELAERCIRAGTSERGACSQCGAPWIRVTERAIVPLQATNNERSCDQNNRGAMPRANVQATTTGWRPSCECGPPAWPIVPCTVLDPFAGAGTTLLVADRLQRDAIGIELSPDYTRLAMQRCQDDAPLFTSFPPASDDTYDSGMRDLFRDAAD